MIGYGVPGSGAAGAAGGAAGVCDVANQQQKKNARDNYLFKDEIEDGDMERFPTCYEYDPDTGYTWICD